MLYWQVYFGFLRSWPTALGFHSWKKFWCPVLQLDITILSLSLDIIAPKSNCQLSLLAQIDKTKILDRLQPVLINGQPHVFDFIFTVNFVLLTRDYIVQHFVGER